jgi:hypothetical protein
MAIRKSYTDAVVVSGTRQDWMGKCCASLESGKFKNIKVSEALFQISADYKKFPTYGDIQITLTPEGSDTRLTIAITAAVDNIYAIFRSPGKHILKIFKDNLS